MERIPSFPPSISSLPADENRPLWSVMIPVYNCAKYIPEVLLSVLAQDMGESQMQIEVVDDASTDVDVEVIVKEIGKGRICYYRQLENVGSLRNFETCINRSRGKLLHLLHGDDRVKPKFYRKITQLFDQYPEAGAAFCNYSFIKDSGKWSHDNPYQAKEPGILKDWLLRIAELQRIQYVAMVVRREVYEKLGSFYGMAYGEDWEMWVRIARYYPVAYVPEILAEYRMHENSITSQMGNSGQSFPNLLRSRVLIQEHIMQENIPVKDKKRIIDKGKQHCALYSIALANGIWKKTHNKLLAQQSIKTALSLSKTPLVYYHILKFHTKVALTIY